MQEKTSLPSLNKGNKIIYGCIVGSYAYGTNVEGSDIDRKWVYVQSAEDLFLNGYKPQINISKDEIMYELSRFLELCQKANPTILEMLYVPKDCILYVHKTFTHILNMRREFLTKQCRYSFAGYAEDKIEKAMNLDKMMNWEKENTERKSVLDFCYFISNKVDPNLRHARFQSQSILKDFTSSEIDRMGLSVIPHARGLYNLYWDAAFNFGGFVAVNDVSTSIIPLNTNCIGLLYFNKDEYSKHCKLFSEYETWLKNRNVQRYVDVKNHNQKIDGKNLLHCIRLIDTALDIAEFRELIVRRENASYLKEIKKGEHNLENILVSARRQLNKLNIIFENSDLPDRFNSPFMIGLINSTIRREIHAVQEKNKLEKNY